MEKMKKEGEKSEKEVKEEMKKCMMEEASFSMKIFRNILQTTIQNKQIIEKKKFQTRSLKIFQKNLKNFFCPFIQVFLFVMLKNF